MAEVTNIHDEEAYESLLEIFKNPKGQYEAARTQFVRYYIDLDQSMYFIPPGERYRDQAKIAQILSRRWITKQRQSRNP